MAERWQSRKKTMHKNRQAIRMRRKRLPECVLRLYQKEILFFWMRGQLLMRSPRELKGLRIRSLLPMILRLQDCWKTESRNCLSAEEEYRSPREVCLADMQQRCWQISNLIWDFSERRLSTMPLKLRHRRLRR